MKCISHETIADTVKELCIRACCELPNDVTAALMSARDNESSEIARDILTQLIENQGMARERKRPCCQDTGMAVVFCDIGNQVFIDCDLYNAINEGVSRAYTDAYLRKSTVSALSRENSRNNTPAVVHIRMIVGEKLHITVAPKGFGSENMSRIAMLKPSQGISGVEDFVVETVRIGGGNFCPPGVVGVGIGGTFEGAALLAKRQLLRPIGKHHENDRVSALEKRLLERINALGIGTMGLGGSTTVLAVHIDEQATHIAGLPVAVNLQCHACRHMEAEL